MAKLVNGDVPELSVSYSNSSPTNQDVTVTITSSDDELYDVEGWNLSEDKKTLTKVYSENKQEDVIVTSRIGIKATVNVNVSNIDKEFSIKSIIPSDTSITNQDVTVTITADEEIQEVEGWTLSEDKKALTKVYSSNGTEEVSVTDLAGNSETVNIEVSNIDKDAPNVKVNYNSIEIINEDVIVTITADEEIQEVDGWKLLKDKKTLAKVFTKNDAEEITVYDLAGNSAIINVEVPNIDKEKPSFSVEYSTTDITNQDVTVTITLNEEIQEVEGWKLSEDKKSLTKVYSENGKEEVTIYDLAGNSAKTNVEVYNINKNISEDIDGDTDKNTNENVDENANKKEEDKVDVNNIQKDIPTAYPNTGSSTYIAFLGIMIFSIISIVIYKKSK